jgi:hypothetical protein
MAPRELTRRALYDLVWLKPMTKVAEEFGISDVGLKKICRKHRVPTPPRGYWARKDSGKQVIRIRFYEEENPRDERVLIYGVRTDLAPEIREMLNRERERRRATPKKRCEVEPIGPIQDPAVASTARALRKVKPDKDGVVSAKGPSHCGIEVSSASVERVIAFLNTLARELESRGQKLEPAGLCMQVAIPPDTVTFTLKERIGKRNHDPIRGDR